MANELAVTYKDREGGEVSLSRDNIRLFLGIDSGEPTDAEMANFFAVCKARRANPLLKEVYLLKYRDNPATTVMSKDYYMRVAAEQETFRGFKAGIAVADKDGAVSEVEGSLVDPGMRLVGGWAKVFDSRFDEPVYISVGMSEYDKGRSSWKTMPATMIRKVALVQAIRECYPREFGGLYDADELQRKDPEPRPVEPVSVEAVTQATPAQATPAQATPAQATPAEAVPARPDPDQQQAMASLAEGLAEQLGADATGVKRAMMAACGRPAWGDSFMEYYGRCVEWASEQLGQRQAGEPLEPEVE